MIVGFVFVTMGLRNEKMEIIEHKNFVRSG
jgi:hypothetical protein